MASTPQGVTCPRAVAAFSQVTKAEVVRPVPVAAGIIYLACPNERRLVAAAHTRLGGV